MSKTFSPARFTDPALFGHVAVLMGGESSEREVSLNSGRNVLEALQSRGVDAVAVDGIQNLLPALQARKFDRVFNILHGGAGENGILQGLLEAYGVPYTGSGVLGSALAMDKIRTKQVWLSEGLETPRYVRIAPGDDVREAAKKLGLPVIIKPSCEGSSVGVSRVFKEDDLQAAVDLAKQYPGELLMEQLIEGDDYTVGVLDGVALATVHIQPAGEYYDYHAKYIADDTVYTCPAFDGEEEQNIRKLAEKAYRALDLKGWARVDFMRDQQGRNWWIEANTAPGMTSHSLVPKSAAPFGIDFPELCWRILETTIPKGAS